MNNFLKNKILISLFFLGFLIFLPNMVKAQPVDPSAFITTWETTTPNESITIPTGVGGSFNYDVDWGDSSTTLGATGNTTHTYVDAGVYTVTITGTFTRIYFNNAGSKNKIKTIEQWGTTNWVSMANAFYGCSNLTITATDSPNGLRNLSLMFAGATSLNSDLSSWNMINVTNMNNMFFNATSFDQNLGNWNLMSVTNMNGMFSGVTLSAANYDALLAGWSAHTLQPNVTFDAGNSKYCHSVDQRAILTSAPNNWTITDGGFDCTGVAYSVSYIAGGNGSITGSTSQTVNYGTDATEVTAVPDLGYQFVDWSDASTQNPRIDTNITGDVTVTANFELIPVIPPPPTNHHTSSGSYLPGHLPSFIQQTPSVVVIPTTSPLNLTRNLYLGVPNGEDIKLLQIYLNTHGYPVSTTGPGSTGNEETTKFGSLTKQAVIKFQLAHHIDPIGVVGPRTRGEINK
ncbi:MAG: BspA family leucine-rich repeat surface protein [Candidatus Nomurabacteria bacterium]|nr:BspA family leucine-rich repeat surface protein [Candidatus Nomurabacteria bacterium]